MMQSFFSAAISTRLPTRFLPTASGGRHGRSRMFCLAASAGARCRGGCASAAKPSASRLRDVGSPGRAQYVEMRIFLSNYLLSSQGDRVAMAHSLELRMPYLGLPHCGIHGPGAARLKIRGLREKYLMKRAVGGDVRSDQQSPQAPLPRPAVGNSLLHPGASADDPGSPVGRRAEAEGLFDAGKVTKLCGKLAAGPEARSRTWRLRASPRRRSSTISSSPGSRGVRQAPAPGSPRRPPHLIGIPCSFFITTSNRPLPRLPDKAALVCADRRWTYGELLAESRRLAGGLKALGVSRQDRVVVSWTMRPRPSSP